MGIFIAGATLTGGILWQAGAPVVTALVIERSGSLALVAFLMNRV